MRSSDYLYTLKLADVKPLYKKSDPDDKTNYRQMIILPSPSKVYEKMLHKQLNSFFETKLSLSPHLCGFPLSNLLLNWQNCLDKSAALGKILVKLSMAFDCLPQ